MPDYGLKVTISAVDKASKTIKNVGKAVEQTKRSFSALGDAVKVAAGMLIRDFVNSAVDAFKSSVELGGKVDTLKKSFEAMTKAAGASGLSLEKLRKATRGTVSDVDLLTAANQALALGLPTDNLDQLFEAAMKLGHAMGIDTKAAVESLTTGIGRQSKQILDNLGVVFQASDAYEWYAQKIGVAADELTEAQKKEAWMAYAIEQVTERAKELGDNISETQLRQEQWNATITNMTTSLGKFLQPLSGIAPMMAQITQIGGPLVGTMLPQLIQSIGGIGAAASSATSLLGSMASFLTGPWGLAIMGAVAGAALLYKAWTEDWGGIRTFITESVLPAIMNALKGFVETASNVWDKFSKLLWAIKVVVLDPLVNAFKIAFDFIGGLFMDFVNTVAGWVDKIMAVIKPIIDFFGGLIDSIGGALHDWTETHQDMLDATEELEQQLVGGSVWTDMLKTMKRQTENYLKGIRKVWGRNIKGLMKEVTVGLGVSFRLMKVAVAVPATPAVTAPSTSTSITTNAPLIQITGVQEEIASYVREQLVKDLSTVLIESTSPGATTKRIRVSPSVKPSFTILPRGVV